ncbi:uncharacterized protein F5147DRAFT_763068 [Suillus discolor]|uniref:Uncharacterized protein n=1 Tax=Suillus discolor TaxID=1912936 RepID=A0A9P7F0W9_9AGAM|nr:uncharacterized protein F5147DRAFT_763068 [Suillus discolor]KAG2099627.1 hypothetical protein F5147DRAFT_763068 [Suillus discolor]
MKFERKRSPSTRTKDDQPQTSSGWEWHNLQDNETWPFDIRTLPGEEQCIANIIKTRMRHDTSETLNGTSPTSTDKPMALCPVPTLIAKVASNFISQQHYVRYNQQQPSSVESPPIIGTGPQENFTHQRESTVRRTASNARQTVERFEPSHTITLMPGNRQWDYNFLNRSGKTFGHCESWVKACEDPHLVVGASNRFWTLASYMTELAFNAVPLA